MIDIYERKAKSLNNLYGIEKVDNNIFEEPCLLCISAQSSIPKSAFGIIREGMDAARIRTTKDTPTSYDIKDFPIKFLGIKTENSDTNISEELINKCFLPLLQSNNEKQSLETLQKKFRNINIMAYCNGTNIYQETEDKLNIKMQELGYTDKEIENAISQISLTSIASPLTGYKTIANTLNIVDVNDTEIENQITEQLQNILKEKNTTQEIAQFSPNNRILFYQGNGKHSLSSFFQNDNLTKLATSINVVTSLQNSLENKNTLDLIPLEKDYHTKELFKYILTNSNKQEESLKDFDQSIIYSGAKNYTESELSLLSEIDTLCNEKINADRKLMQEENKRSKLTSDIESLTNAVKLNTTEEVYYDILEQGLSFQRPSSTTAMENSYFESPKTI